MKWYKHIALSSTLLMVWMGGSSAANAAAYFPAKGQTSVYTDTRLQLTFDAAPSLGASGTINIYKRNDDSLVDTIDLSLRHPAAALSNALVSVDAIGNNVASLSGFARRVYYTPVKIVGNVATIYPHNNVLQNNTAYYVTIDSSAFSGRLGGASFAGIPKASDWTFTTKAAPTGVTVTVDGRGAADFGTVQGALNYMMSTACTTCANAALDKTVIIKNGTYDELLYIKNVNQLTLVGESAGGVVVQYDNFDSFNPGTGNGNAASGIAPSLGGGRSVLFVEASDLLTLSTFTLKNSHVKSSSYANQAEALYFNSATSTGSRLIGKYMNFLSAQDTINTKGWAWFYQSLVAGDVDFIWGGAFAGLFEQCEIRTVADTVAPAKGGYIVQARTQYGYPGFVFLNSTLTAASGVPVGSTYLARSPGAASNRCAAAGNPCDNVAYINTKMGAHVRAAGWNVTPIPNPAVAVDSTGWREYGSMDAAGARLDVSERDSHSVQLSDDFYTSNLSTRAKVFSQWNNHAGWSPVP